jgi:sRNA-binding carbon storage regulator CsrA
MTRRNKSQKIGSLGEKLVSYIIENDENWLVRNQNEDFGIDLEAELTTFGINGDLIKIQVKSTTRVKIIGDKICFDIENKYLTYALNCRLPIIYVLVDIVKKDAWYVWLQGLLYSRIDIKEGLFKKEKTRIYLSTSANLVLGLKNDLQTIASGKNKLQFQIELMALIKITTTFGDENLTEKLINVLNSFDDAFYDISNELVIKKFIEEAISEAAKTATYNGPDINKSLLLYKLARISGAYFSIENIKKMVFVEERNVYSLAGFNTLDILYDEYFDHIKKMRLFKIFNKNKHPRLYYYTKLREKYPHVSLMSILFDHNNKYNKNIGDLTIKDEDLEWIWGKGITRGNSSILYCISKIE